MIAIAYPREKDKLKAMPQEVQKLQILDTEYGASRSKDEDDGGYIIVV